MVQAVWKGTFRVIAPWSKRQNLAIAVGERVTLCVVSSVRASRFHLCDLIAILSVLFANPSRVIAPNLVAAAAAVVAGLEHQVVVVLGRNAIAAARSVTLRVRAPRRPEEEAAQEAMAVEEEEEEEEEEEATEVLGAGVVAVKRHGALSLAVFRVTEGYQCFRFVKLHLWWSRPSIA
jgi:hypothetical protein